MAYDVTAKITANDLKTALDKNKEYTDAQIDEIRKEMPVIPESLPANGGNADTANLLNYSVFGSSNTVAPYYKFAKAVLPANSTTNAHLVLQITDLVILSSNNSNGILHLRVRPAQKHFITEWEIAAEPTKLQNFICAYKQIDNDVIIEWYYKAYGAYDRIQVSVLSSDNTKTIKLLDTNTSDGLDIIPEDYTIIESSIAPLLNTKELETEVADLKAYIGYTDSDIYGLEADFENNKFTRLAGSVGKTAGADFDSVKAFGGRRRCTLFSDGSIAAYYGDSNYDEDGRTTTESGSPITQVMVEQPKFYYKVVPLKTEKIESADGYHLRKARYYISDTPKSGFKVHPAFVQNGVEKDKIYLSAYEGCIFDTSAHAYYLNDEQTADFNTDYIGSIAGAAPASGITQALTRANARKLARNMGKGWDITAIQTLSATQLLFAIEYATFNGGTGLGYGFLGGADTSKMAKTGSTSSLGNASGAAENGAISYRGEENIWGNMWMWCDGINIYNENSDYGKCYIMDNDFQDSTVSSLSASILNSHGYPSAFQYSENLDWLFIPTENKGNSAMPIGGYFRNPQKNSWRVAMVGGGGTTEQNLCAMSCTYDVNGHRPYTGARLIYIPQNTTETQEVTAND